MFNGQRAHDGDGKRSDCKWKPKPLIAFTALANSMASNSASTTDTGAEERPEYGVRWKLALVARAEWLSVIDEQGTARVGDLDHHCRPTCTTKRTRVFSLSLS